MTFKTLQFKKLQKGLVLSKSKGFTLIELLVVIAIIGILAVGLIALINPADKVKSASDQRAISDISAIGKSLEIAASGGAAYPVSCAALNTAGGGRGCPAAQNGYTYTWTGVTAAGAGYIWTTLTSSKYTGPGTTIFQYDVTKGKTCAVATAPTVTAVPCT